MRSRDFLRRKNCRSACHVFVRSIAGVDIGMPQGVMQARVACEHLAMCSHCEAGGAGREGKRKGGRQGRDEEAGGQAGKG